MDHQAPDNLQDAIRNRSVRGYRFDNSSFWLAYYENKRLQGRFDRERRYAKLLQSKLGPGAHVADVGCGIGFLSLEMAAAGLKVAGVDLFPAMIKAAKAHIGNSCGVQLLRAEAIQLPFGDKTLDAVVAMSLIEHFPILEVQLDLLPEFHRILRSDGYLFIHVPVRSPKSQLIRFWRRHIRRDLSHWAIDDDEDITHKIWRSFVDYVELVEEAGFRLEGYDFQLTHSKTRPGVLWIAKRLKGILDFVSGQAFTAHPLTTRAHLSVFMKLLLATSCHCLFRKP